ncbi:MAG: hypothetical protein Q9187_002771 [Circinaria calcarea]
MPLKVIIVGAGIAGLSAAVSLRLAGHSVEIFEKSLFAAETGAALAISPNGSRVLAYLGFSFERAQAQPLRVWETVHGTSLERISCLDFSNCAKRYGGPFMAVHRVDLQKELLKLALEGAENPATLRLGAKVAGVREQEGMIELQDGSLHQADLIVAADGLHSVVRSAVLKRESKATASGLSAFRFLIPTERLKGDPTFEKILKWKGPGVTLLADTTDTINERHLVWYDCHGGDVQNLVGIHPTRAEPDGGEEDIKASLLEEFQHFSPDFVKILNIAEDVKVWPLKIHTPLPKWTYGKVLLIGDAAHPMLPFGGQGANQSIEDGGALGYLLKDVNDANELFQRLAIFETVRRNRASRVQTLSKMRMGKEKEIEAELRLYADDDDTRTFVERT